MPIRVTLFVSAIGVIEPHLNGAAVGDDVLVPGWTPYRERLVLSRHDVTAHLIIGANRLGAVLGQGWAVGCLGMGGPSQPLLGSQGWLPALELQYSDRTDTVGTDEHFRAGRGGLGENGIYNGETFEARREPGVWDRPGFDDQCWYGVAALDWPMEILIEPVAPPHRRARAETS